MATNSKAIGLLFEVAGRDNINGETGRRINGQLKGLVGQLNKSDTVKLKFQIDSNAFRKELEALKKQMANFNMNVKATGNGGTGGGATNTKAQTQAYREASNAITNYYNLLTQVNQAMTRTTEISGSQAAGFSTTSQRWQELVTQVNDAKTAFDSFTSSQQMSAEQQAMIAERVTASQNKLNLQTQTFEANGQAAWSNLTAKVSDYITRVEGAAQRDETAKQGLAELRNMANSTDWRGYDALKTKLGEVQQYINQNALATETWYQKMLKTFGTRVRSMLAGLILAKVTQSLRDLYDNVVKIDSAMTQLKIVTGATDRQMTAFLTNSTKLAKELGSSISDVLASIETFSRLGYKLEDASILSKYATILSKVANVSTEEATTGLTSIIKGYQMDVSNAEHVADVLVEVGQKYAVSASEMMEAYEKSGAALSATNTSFEKSAGLIAAANASVQDASVVGTALKTISARIRKSTTDLEELGESTDDLAEGFSKYAKEIKALTGFDILVEGTQDTYKDLYDIFAGISQSWNTLSDTQQARISEILGGTRQLQVVSSILANWQDSADAYESAIESAGTSTEAMGVYMDSIEGKIGQFKATFEEFSTNLLQSDLVTGLITIGNTLLNIVSGTVSVLNSIGGLKTALIALAATLLIVKGGLIAYTVQMKAVAIYQAILVFFTKLKAGFISVINIIPNAIVAWKAYAAGTVTASTAMQASIPVIGLVLAAVTALVGGLTLLNGSTDESKSKIKEASDTATDLSNDLYDLTNKYIELSRAVSTDDSAKESLIETQNELIKKLGLEKYEVEGLIDKYGSYTEAIKQASLAKLQEEERDIRGGMGTATDELLDAGKEKFFGESFMEISSSKSNGLFSTSAETRKEQTSAYNALKALEEAGFVSSGSYSSYTDDKTGLKYSQGFASYSRYKYDMDTPEGIMQAYNDLGKMLDIVGDTSGENNFVYKALYEEYNSMSSSIDAYKKEVDDLNTNLAQQYSISGLINRELPTSQEEFNTYREEVVQAAIASGEFAGTEDDVRRAIDSVLQQQSQFSAFYQSIGEKTSGLSVSLKSILSILDETQDGFDGLSDAIQEMNQNGYLSASTLSNLAKLEDNGALAGIKLADVLEQDANGYKIADTALQQYVDNLIKQYTVTQALATVEDKNNAIENLKRLQAVLATLVKTQNTSKNATSEQKKLYEEQKDEWKDQLKAYDELIDIRKKLLKTYESEEEYQKSLSKKQKTVAKLQTQLAVAQLDKSAAGQAKARQIASDLQEAQDDLDDFTLEHAIDVVTDELDAQYAEYENFINGKLDEIEAAIDGLNTTPDVDVDVDMTWVNEAINKIDDVITAVNGLNIANDDAPQPSSDAPQPSSDAPRPSSALSAWTSYSDAAAAGYSNIRTANEFARSNNADKQKYGTYQKYLEAMYEKYTTKYHSGGIVGDIATMNSSEEFAKLLKGEFVSTPVQMKKFMEETLPTMVSYGADGRNEFNSPLIEIKCESITSEAMPKLKEVVDEAVTEIKKKLDSGMSRTGYKQSIKRRLT